MVSSSLPDAGEIETSADEFRKQYASGHFGPLNIELILEKKMGIEIVPIPNLCKKTKNKGFVAHGGKMIGVDKNIMRDQPEQYRQTLGHEAAHIRRHREMMPKGPFDSIGD